MDLMVSVGCLLEQHNLRDMAVCKPRNHRESKAHGGCHAVSPL
jgi:hypothetical protein